MIKLQCFTFILSETSTNALSIWDYLPLEYVDRYNNFQHIVTLIVSNSYVLGRIDFTAEETSYIFKLSKYFK